MMYEKDRIDLPPPPCDNCEHEDDCRKHFMSCDAFAVYISGGDAMDMRRIPSRNEYNAQFKRYSYVWSRSDS